MKIQTSTLRSRMTVIINEIEERLKLPGMSASKLARQVLEFHGFRRELTHSLDYVGSTNNRSIRPSHWVVIYRKKVEGEKKYTHSEPFETEEEARKFLKEQWGPVDEELMNWLLQEYVQDLDFKKQATEASDLDKLVSSVAETITTLHNYRSNPHSLGFPISYSSVERFGDALEQHQNDLLKNIKKALDSVGVITRGDRLSLSTKSEWQAEKGDVTYPLDKIEPMRLYVNKNQQIYTLMAIEEFLFNTEDEPLLLALAKSHKNLYEEMDEEKCRPSLNQTTSPLGTMIGRGDSLADLIEHMTKTGFDSQPVFDEDEHCIGTLELKNIMYYLQANGNDFSPFEVSLNYETLQRMDLLSPAPPLLDAHLPLHRAGEILYTAKNFGCVMVKYTPKLWKDAKDDDQKTLKTYLAEGIHIFTTHDYVMACIQKSR